MREEPLRLRSRSMATTTDPLRTRTLSEADSKLLLARLGVTFAPERVVDTADQAAVAASEIGFPVVVKLCGDAIAHKTERGLVRLDLGDSESVRTAGTELLGRATPEDGPVQLLVAAMVRGNRELIAGVADDPQFGKTVMLGVGGVLAEAIGDAVFRLAPVSRLDASEMIDDLATQKLLGPFRGEPAVDREALAHLLVTLSDAAGDGEIVSIDLNPLIVSAGIAVPVDALVEVRA